MLGLCNFVTSDVSVTNLGGFGRPWDSLSWLHDLWGALGDENEKFEVLKFDVATFDRFT